MQINRNGSENTENHGIKEIKNMEKNMYHKQKFDIINSHYAIEHNWFYCTGCKVYFHSHIPYKLDRFFIDGIWYAIPRPIKGLYPACPDCRKRDNVELYNRKKKYGRYDK